MSADNGTDRAADSALMERMLERIRTMELSRFWKVRNAFFVLRERLGLSPIGALPPFELDATERSIVAGGGPYARWLVLNRTRASDLARLAQVAAVLPLRPTISIAMVAFDSSAPHLTEALDSVLAQVYPHWELCVAGSSGPGGDVSATLRAYAAKDARVRSVVAATDDSDATAHAGNAALALATGEFVVFLDAVDALTPDACFEIALHANGRPGVDIVYSDEDRIDDAGILSDPFFKPDWAPDSFLSRMYTGRLAAYRRTLVADVGGLRAGFGGCEEYDLMLRLTERTARIGHVPRILYHRRVREPSGDNAAATSDAAVRALGEALERRGEPGDVAAVAGSSGVYIVRYRRPERAAISIVVPTRDHGDDVERCLTSVVERSTHRDFEILLVDNGSTDARTRAILAAWPKRDPRVRLLAYDVPFNYAKINNWAVARASGSLVVLLNNDTEIVTPDWLEALAEQASRPSIGAVGAMLLYDDDTVQHGGVIVGINGVAGHSHKHLPHDAPGYFDTLKAVNNYSAVTAACLMVRKAVYDRLGGLEESLAVAFNDVDFCLKALEAGLRNVWLPHVVLRHAESKSRGLDTTFARRRILHREEAYMKSRWGTDVRPDPYYSPHLTLRSEDYALRLESPATPTRQASAGSWVRPNDTER